MNILGALLGAMVLTKSNGYPKEINELKRQIPKAERETFLKQYKGLSGKDKTDFKAALAKADLAEAGKIIGRDLSQFQVKPKKTADEMKPGPQETSQDASPQPESDIITRINKILAMPTSIDPELVAEAARRYEESVPSSGNGAVNEKPKLEVIG